MEIETRSVFPVDLELRQDGREIVGSFPYNSLGVISDRGRVRKETFRSRAFSFAVNDPAREISLLYGHEFSKPLASKLRRSLELTESDSALDFRAALPPISEQPTWMQDTVLSIRGGLLGGLSPGFRVPPRSVVPGAEFEEAEAGNPGVFIRNIVQAMLGEMSVVARPTYTDTFLDLRHDLDLSQPANEETLWRLL